MGEDYSELMKSLLSGIPDNLPDHPGYDESVDHAPIVDRYWMKVGNGWPSKMH